MSWWHIEDKTTRDLSNAQFHCVSNTFQLSFIDLGYCWLVCSILSKNDWWCGQLPRPTSTRARKRQWQWHEYWKSHNRQSDLWDHQYAWKCMSQQCTIGYNTHSRFWIAKQTRIGCFFYFFKLPWVFRTNVVLKASSDHWPVNQRYSVAPDIPNYRLVTVTEFCELQNIKYEKGESLN